MEAPNKLITDETEKIYLSLLPNEILLQIFGMLPPLSLLAVERTNRNFLSLTCDQMVLRNIDFSHFSSISHKDLSDFFIPARAAFITVLNFDDCKWIGSTILENCIEKCDRLNTLSVRNCDLALTAIFNIMTKVKCIKNLSWTVGVGATGNQEKAWTTAPTEALNSLEKVYFEFKDKKFRALFRSVWDEFLPSCNNLQELQVNFMLISLFEFDGAVEFTERKILSSLDSLTITYSSAAFIFQSLGSPAIESIAKLLYGAKSPGKKWKKLWIDNSIRCTLDFSIVNKGDVEDFNCVECLQINCVENISDHGREFPPDTLVGVSISEVFQNVSTCSVHTLGACQLELLHTDKIIATCGKRLKRFTSKCYTHSRIPVKLQDLFTACCNITELNLEGIHFDGSTDSPCTAVCNLKSLQRVVLTSCAIENFSRQKQAHTLKKFEICNPFADMVENCKFVKEFHLHGCIHVTCGSYLDEETIESIYLWEKLEYLLLDKLEENDHSCKFLKKIAINCKSFKTLCLIDVGNCIECHYLPYLSFLLKNAHCLSSLKIEQWSPDLLCKNIWHSISHAQGLERICISTVRPNERRAIFIKSIISKLPKLRMFHFFFYRFSLEGDFGLTPRIKKVFETHTHNPDFKADHDFAAGDERRHECHFENLRYISRVAEPLPLTLQ